MANIEEAGKKVNQSKLEYFINEFNNLLENYSNNNRHLKEIEEKINGAEPKDIKEAKEAPYPEKIIGKLHNLVDKLTYLNTEYSNIKEKISEFI